MRRVYAGAASNVGAKEQMKKLNRSIKLHDYFSDINQEFVQRNHLD
jgi:hypothetical protein